MPSTTASDKAHLDALWAGVCSDDAWLVGGEVPTAVDPQGRYRLTIYAVDSAGSAGDQRARFAGNTREEVLDAYVSWRVQQRLD